MRVDEEASPSLESFRAIRPLYLCQDGVLWLARPMNVSDVGTLIALDGRPFI
jgi:hypothetical protein